MVALESTEKVLSEGNLWHDIDLSRVIESGNEDPLSVIPQVLELLFPDDVAKLFEVATNLLK